MTHRQSPLPHGLLLSGSWEPEQVDLLWQAEAHRPPAWQEEVESRWAALRRSNPHLFDAPLAALHHAASHRDRLRLTLSESRYRFTAATMTEQANDWLARFGPQGLGHGLACALGLVCPQGLVLARRSQRVHGGQGQLHPIAGHFDPTVHQNTSGQPCPFTAMRVETEEETGLGDLQDLRLTGVQRHPLTHKPELHFVARTPLAFTEIQKLAATAPDAHEHDALVALTPSQAGELAQAAGEDATAVARACAWLVRKHFFA